MNVDRENSTASQKQLPVSARFQRRMIELTREGVFGGLKTRHKGLQSAYRHLLTLLDNPEVPILFYGDKGTGKRRHLDELLQIHNFARKLDGLPEGRLKVFRADFVAQGFTRLLQMPETSEADIVYVEDIELLNKNLQEELLDFLKNRKTFATKGLPLPRLVLGAKNSLAVPMICGEFSKDLYQAIAGFAVFFPTLKERSEDLIPMIQACVEEITGKPQTPPGWFVDFASRREWAGNIDELRALLRDGLARNNALATWTTKDLPPAYQARSTDGFKAGFPDEDVQAYRNVMAACRGDRRAGAKMMGMPYVDFLQRLLELKIR